MVKLNLPLHSRDPIFFDDKIKINCYSIFSDLKYFAEIEFHGLSELRVS